MRTKALKDKAYDRFRKKLFTRELLPGQMVSLRQLVDLIDVPIAPIREAIQRLQSEGLVRVHPQRGIQIAEADINFVREAFQLRLVLEREGIDRLVGIITPEECDALERQTSRLIEDSSKFTTPADLASRTVTIDENFHDTIIRALNNETIRDVYNLNRDRLRLIKPQLGLPPGGRTRPAMTEHLRVIEALRQRDAPEARLALEDHLAASLRRHIGL